MQTEWQLADSTEDDAATDQPAMRLDAEQPIDLSVNAGREAFGNVSDFGVQPNIPDSDDHERRGTT